VRVDTEVSNLISYLTFLDPELSAVDTEGPLVAWAGRSVAVPNHIINTTALHRFGSYIPVSPTVL
jgi:hypothetical protein